MIVFSNLIDVFWLYKLQYMSVIHWTNIFIFMRKSNPISIIYIVTVEILVIIILITYILKKVKVYIECIGDDLMNELVISIKNAYKKFGEQVVLNDVSLEIYKGRIYGIIGRNGSGKTVLFKSICGFILLDSGEITVSDKVIGKDVDMPKNVGLIIETPGFLKDYSAYWNLKFLADLNKKITNDDIKNAIRRVGLNPEDKSCRKVFTWNETTTWDCAGNNGKS